MSSSIPHSRGPVLLTPGYLFNSDPTCREIDGRFWVFCTHDQATELFQGPEDFWNNMMDYHAYSTDDFRHWVDHGSILSIHDAPWASGQAVWDGDAGICGPDGRYYAYIPFRNRRFEIGALVADRPQGPYKDALGRPMITRQTMLDARMPLEDRFELTSPTVIRCEEEGGRLYLLWGQFQVFIAPLAADMTSFDGPIVELDIPKRCGEATEFIEGPILHRMNGRYYLTYMTYKNWDGGNANFAPDDPPGPYLQYCVAERMLGPYRNHRHWVYPITPDACNVQHGIGCFQGQWYAAYHVPFGKKQHRKTVVTRLHAGPDGSLAAIHPAVDPGVAPQEELSLTLDAYAFRREAEEFHLRYDAVEERAVKQDFHFKLKAGGYLGFHRVDFGAGAAAYRVAISCENHAIRDAVLEFRIDAPDGPVIAVTDPVTFTFMLTYHKVYIGPVRLAVSGVHDLYLVARGEGGDAYGRLFNVNWFGFDPAAKESV